MKTVLEVIQATTAFLAKNHIESPRLNIEHLLAHTLGICRMDLYLAFDRTLSEAELAPLRDLVRRRATGEPLQHILGTVPFLSLTLRCDRRALIPRPETEELCERIINLAKTAEVPWKDGHIVDVGTGSGCIALALAHAFPAARITAIDASADALALAQENATACGLTERIQFKKSDLLNSFTGPAHCIVANLPYIPTHEIPALQREVQYDPRSALDGGADGLTIVRRLIPEAQQTLHGLLALELHHDQPALLAEELTCSGFRDVEVAKDYSGRDRFLFAWHDA